MGDADAGVQEAQVVVDLGDRADGRPRVPGGRLLVDRDGRGQALDEVDVRLVHLAEELPGVRRQRLHVPSLPLGVDRVEGQGGLARPGQAGEHDQRVPREVQRDVLEVVLPSPPNYKHVAHERTPYKCDVPNARSRLLHARSCRGIGPLCGPIPNPKP